MHQYTDAERELHINRSLNKLNGLYTSIHINKHKLKDSTKLYLRNLVSDQLLDQSRSTNFDLKDVYFSYTDLDYRCLMVVIKHDDSTATETFGIVTNCFDT